MLKHFHADYISSFCQGDKVIKYELTIKSFIIFLHIINQKNIIEKNAKSKPDITINELFNELYLSALKEVRHEQQPLMKHIKFLGESLPDDYIEVRIRKLGENTQERQIDFASIGEKNQEFIKELEIFVGTGH